MLFVLAAVVAALAPASRALSIDPVSALRHH
jgi:ABC-type lipoprotein release transport system permease subunit